MRLTAADVHHTSFDRTPLGRRGYRRAEVDEFLAKAERALLGTELMTPSEIDRVTFARSRIGTRGYDEEQVDTFLDQLEKELAARMGPRGPRWYP
jgi:DivIVA domain-containing protein